MAFAEAVSQRLEEAAVQQLPPALGPPSASDDGRGASEEFIPQGVEVICFVRPSF